MQYDEVKYLYENTDTHAWCYSLWEWANKGIRAPANGGPAVTYGAGINNDQDPNKTRWRTDGLAAMQNLVKSPQSHWLRWTPWGFNDCIDHGHGMMYSAVAGIDYTFEDRTKAVLEFTAETDHSSSSEQCIEADSSNGVAQESRYDWYKNWTNEHHYYWGSNVWFRFGVPGAVPHTIYTY